MADRASYSRNTDFNVVEGAVAGAVEDTIDTPLGVLPGSSKTQDNRQTKQLVPVTVQDVDVAQDVDVTQDVDTAQKAAGVNKRVQEWHDDNSERQIVTTTEPTWGTFFKQSKSLLGIATTVAAQTAVQVGSHISDKYNEKVPDSVKEKVSTSSHTILDTITGTTKAVAQKSTDIFDQNVRPTVYNTTIGYFYTKELARCLLLEIPENSTILDIGIGTCYSYAQNADIIKQRKIKIVGVDIDESYIHKARHALIDAELEDWIELICADIYESDEKINGRTFDYVVFSDSYAVLPNVNNMLRYCERFMNDIGYMIVTSTLFDEYMPNLDLIKKNLKYVSAVEYGTMMLKCDLENYIVQERHSEDYEFKMIKQITIASIEFKSYIVRWRPG